MTATYTILSNLAKEIQLPDKGVFSRTIFSDERVKAIAFGFAAGEELSEHTASMPAILQILSGNAALTLGDDRHEAAAGTWVHMPAGLKHSVKAETPVLMLLLLLK